MKANVKARRQFTRDALAAETMLFYMLGELHKNEGFGKIRLQRMYDAIMLEMYKDVCNAEVKFGPVAWDTYQRFALDNELTPEAFAERQQEALQAFEAERRARV